jgi:hypothetical protein
MSVVQKSTKSGASPIVPSSPTVRRPSSQKESAENFTGKSWIKDKQKALTGAKVRSPDKRSSVLNATKDEGVVSPRFSTYFFSA